MLRLANEQQAVLVTSDKDFGELVYRLNRITTGVVLIRMEGLTLVAKASIVARVFRDHAVELPGAFCVITPGLVRIRAHS